MKGPFIPLKFKKTKEGLFLEIKKVKLNLLINHVKKKNGNKTRTI